MMKRATDNTPRVAIGYGRVSLEKQVLNGTSLEVQREKFQSWCLLHDYTFDPANWFTDGGISGKAMSNRPAFMDAVDKACAVKGVLVIYSLDRFGRNLRETLDMAHRIELAGANLCSISENFDTTSAMGVAVFQIFAVIAELVRGQTGEKTANALQHLKSIGRRVTRLPPYGFAWAKCGEKPDGKPVFTTEADLGEQTILLVIRAMHELRPDMPLRQMSRELAGLCLFGRSGKPFCASTLSLLLRRKDKE